MRALGAATTWRVLAAAEGGRLTLFTAYADAEPIQHLLSEGASVLRNSYDWVSGWAPESTLDLSARVVVGSALVEDGFVTAEAYESWLAGLVLDGAISYVPHRRESASTLARWARVAGVEIVHPRIPIELVLGSSPAVKRVTTLPSSVVATLGTLLDPRVEMRVDRVPDAWFTGAADSRLRALLCDVAALGPRRVEV